MGKFTAPPSKAQGPLVNRPEPKRKSRKGNIFVAYPENTSYECNITVAYWRTHARQKFEDKSPCALPRSASLTPSLIRHKIVACPGTVEGEIKRAQPVSDLEKSGGAIACIVVKVQPYDYLPTAGCRPRTPGVYRRRSAHPNNHRPNSISAKRAERPSSNHRDGICRVSRKGAKKSSRTYRGWSILSIGFRSLWGNNGRCRNSSEHWGTRSAGDCSTPSRQDRWTTRLIRWIGPTRRVCVGIYKSSPTST